jgi:hypothetical protein
MFKLCKVVKTTTANIEIVHNQSVILEKAKTKSFFKKAYILENSLAIKHLICGNNLPVIVDLTKIETVPVLGLYQLIRQKKSSVKASLAFVINSKYKFCLFKILKMFTKRNKYDFQIFYSREEAFKWLS